MYYYMLSIISIVSVKAMKRYDLKSPHLELLIVHLPFVFVLIMESQTTLNYHITELMRQPLWGVTILVIYVESQHPAP